MKISCATSATYEIPPGRSPELDVFGLFRYVLKEAFRKWSLRPSEVDSLLTPLTVKFQRRGSIALPQFHSSPSGRRDMALIDQAERKVEAG